jgi:RND family efflux transporter MFP subunit
MRPIVCSALSIFFIGPVLADEPSMSEGFSEPYRTVHVAAPDSGIVSEVMVEEGTTVQEGQELVRLDTDVYESLLALADADRKARGRVDAARAEVDMRKARRETIEQLYAAGHARQEELERAITDSAVADGQLTSALEQQQLKQLEYAKIMVQINRRTIRAPLAGVVTEVFKEVGEFVAPNDPNLLSIVQLDPLAATFHVTSTEAEDLHVGDKASVNFVDTGTTASGVIEYIAPVIDAESGTTRVKVKIPNPDGELQGGAGCTLER